MGKVVNFRNYKNKINDSKNNNGSDNYFPIDGNLALKLDYESRDNPIRDDYDVFGNPILTVEQYPLAIRYAGEFCDVETGLYY
ncbi:MAG: hypothetical protein C0412_13535, partial [Flavobacterium sp.]|nr:hypothetical protein [Flavobacterium sp.]